ncbi:hypothetical protein [Phenylobacterium sp.]|uniref:hypothetical protein n=1 Tax=Phenylobacterium sp. TaxID=1871053 RepID=UPI0027349797|nr:hypothetical protein [Phenylobacterium sp.]MDP3635159.1 hypothetical protein [Phenylobacterium sp.]
MKVPPTLWPAPDADWRLPSELIETIQKILTQPAPKDLSTQQRHDLAQKRLAQLGRDLGYEARIEVPTGHRAMVYQGRFDVVWFAPETQKSIVFEIDRRWKRESIVKLGRLPDSQLRLWIYYGNRFIPDDPVDPGLRKLNILRIDPEHLGLPGPRKAERLSAGHWPEALYPTRADHSARGGRPGEVM